MAHDGAAKAYVLNLGEALNHERRPAGVKVIVMMPGNVDTPVIEALGVDRDLLPLSPLPVRTAIGQTIRALQAGHATIVPDRRLRAVARLTPRRISIKMNGRMLGGAAQTLAAQQPDTPARRPDHTPRHNASDQ
jgi:short-subunit dehydrogenase